MDLTTRVLQDMLLFEDARLKEIIGHLSKKEIKKRCKIFIRMGTYKHDYYLDGNLILSIDFNPTIKKI